MVKNAMLSGVILHALIPPKEIVDDTSTGLNQMLGALEPPFPMRVSHLKTPKGR